MVVYDCNNFNQDIGNYWDVSIVTNMEGMFYGCSQFNQDISRWNVGNVTNMDSMFSECTNFNPNESVLIRSKSAGNPLPLSRIVKSTGSVVSPSFRPPLALILSK